MLWLYRGAVLLLLSYLVLKLHSMEKTLMSTAATITDVNAGLTTLEADVASVKAVTDKLAIDSAEILSELKNLQNQPNPDLTNVVARQTALSASLQSIAASLTAVDAADVALIPPAPPTPPAAPAV